MSKKHNGIPDGSPENGYELMKKPVPTDDEKSAAEDLILNNFCGAGCANDCTGLVPTGRQRPDNENAYRSIRPHKVPLENGGAYEKNDGCGGDVPP